MSVQPHSLLGEADGLTKAEAEQMAFLASAGGVPTARSPQMDHATAPEVLGEADGLTKAEAEQMAFLAKAGAVPSARSSHDAQSKVGDRPFNR